MPEAKPIYTERWQGTKFCSCCEVPKPRVIHVEIPVSERTATVTYPTRDNPTRRIELDLCEECMRDLCIALLRA